jgi:hypothetical protein
LEQLRYKHIKHIDQVEHWGPGLIDHVQADRTRTKLLYILSTPRPHWGGRSW